VPRDDDADDGGEEDNDNDDDDDGDDDNDDDDNDDDDKDDDDDDGGGGSSITRSSYPLPKARLTKVLIDHHRSGSSAGRSLTARLRRRGSSRGR
jgi:hypothetical protein